MSFERTPLEWVQLPARHSHILRPRGLIQCTELQLQTRCMVGANARLAALVKKGFKTFVLETANHTVTVYGLYTHLQSDSAPPAFMAGCQVR